MDHTPVIDYYTSQYDLMMEGNVYYCAQNNEYVILKMGPVACMADRPENSYLLKSALLGCFGQVASHVGQIVFDLFPDCARCFRIRLRQVLADPHSLVNLDRCATCMQWDFNCRSAAASKVNVPENV